MLYKFNLVASLGSPQCRVNVRIVLCLLTHTYYTVDTRGTVKLAQFSISFCFLRTPFVIEKPRIYYLQRIVLDQTFFQRVRVMTRSTDPDLFTIVSTKVMEILSTF